MMKITSTTNVGDMVIANFKTAQIFDRYKIDFCCGGDISLEEACQKSAIDVGLILPELRAALAVNDPNAATVDTLALNELCDYIEEHHHRYINEQLPFLQAKLQKLCEVHDRHHPELITIKALFDGAAESLSVHLKKEELILFPYLKRLVKYSTGALTAKGAIRKAGETIHLLDEEHAAENARFAEISALTSGYTCPPDGCLTFQITYSALKDFEDNLHQHIHLENNILFKKALLLEHEIIHK